MPGLLGHGERFKRWDKYGTACGVGGQVGGWGG